VFPNLYKFSLFVFAKKNKNKNPRESLDDFVMLDLKVFFFSLLLSPIAGRSFWNFPSSYSLADIKDG
jgi:hypothetical protein